MRERKNHILLYPWTGNPFTIKIEKVTKMLRMLTSMNI